MPDFAVIILLVLLVVGYVIIRASRSVSTATKKLESRKANTVSARMRVVVDGKEVQSVDLGKITLKGKASDDWIELDSINFSGRIASENWKAKIYLQIGDIYAKFKMVDQAKANYHAAKLENPKAAVIRRLQRLEKISQTGVEEGGGA
jgi:predicted negative regulator of RcsB-dependent stress response